VKVACPVRRGGEETQFGCAPCSYPTAKDTVGCAECIETFVAALELWLGSL
jgi:hypothetical protein